MIRSAIRLEIKRQVLAEIRLDSAFQVHVPPNNGLQGDAPRAARP